MAVSACPGHTGDGDLIAQMNFSDRLAFLKDIGAPCYSLRMLHTEVACALLYGSCVAVVLVRIMCNAEVGT